MPCRRPTGPLLVVRRERIESMGCYCLYLIPADELKAPRQAVRDAKSLLTEQGIVRRPPKGKDEFAPGHFRYDLGNNSLVAFDLEANPPWPAFETCFLYGDERPEVVPQFAAVAPRCPRCGAGSDYYEFINAGHVEEPIECRACGHRCRIDELKDDVGVFLSKFYICFDDTNGSQLKPTWLQELSTRLGIPFVVKEYWYS